MTNKYETLYLHIETVSKGDVISEKDIDLPKQLSDAMVGMTDEELDKHISIFQTTLESLLIPALSDKGIKIPEMIKFNFKILRKNAWDEPIEFNQDDEEHFKKLNTD